MAEASARIHSTSQDATPKPHPLVTAHSWHLRLYTEQHAAFVLACDAFCNAILGGYSARWLSALGSSGIGKTYMLKQILRFLKDQAYRGSWKCQTATGRKTPEIAHVIAARDLDTYTAAREYARFDLIYLEDIGAGQGLEKGAGAVLRGRIAELLQLRSNKFTLLCSNMSRGAIETAFDGRIASRLKRDNNTCVEFPANTPDFQQIQPEVTLHTGDC